MNISMNSQTFSLALVIIPALALSAITPSHGQASPLPSRDDILVSTGRGFTNPNVIEEYSPSGVHLRSLLVPLNSGSYSSNGTEYLRGISVMDSGQIACWNGAFTPQLDIYQPSTGLFTISAAAEVHNPNIAYMGSLATYQGYSFVVKINPNNYGPPSAIVRYNLDGTTQTLGDGVQYVSLSTGLDGKLYALYSTMTYPWYVDVFDPISLRKLRTILLHVPRLHGNQTTMLRSLAVDKLGGVYSCDLSKYVYRFDANGNLLTTSLHGHEGFCDDIKIDPNDGNRILITFGKYGAEIVQTDANLSTFSTLITLDPNQALDPYIAFSNSKLAAAIFDSQHVLWTHGDDGRIMVSELSGTGTSIDRVYSTSKGWTAKAIADSRDGLPHILWTHAPDGLVSVWNINQGGNVTRRGYGPFTGQHAVAMSAGMDEKLHILWSCTDGVQIVWGLDNTTGAYTHAEYGPCPGWTATSITTGVDNVTHIMWKRNSDAQMSVWDLKAYGFTRHTYGPFAGQTPQSISAGPDGKLHPLWSYSNGANSMESLWTMDYISGSFMLAANGRTGGWLVKAETTDASNVSRILWSRPDGTASLWAIQPDGSYAEHTYGPYLAWTAVDIAAHL
jgi:hypothetical protein